MQLPEEFTTYTRQMMGDSLYARYAAGMLQPPPVSIRLHPQKSRGHEVGSSLAGEDVPWCHLGHYLSHRPNFTFDPLLHAGAYYVQDAASMFIDKVIRQHVTQPVVMLDLCAAPGGKTTAALSALPDGSMLFANEPIPSRARILLENIQKYGHQDVVVTNNYAPDYVRSGLRFDVILADVPCSGEGMFRKDEGAITEWSVHNVAHCQQLQRQIVEDIWSCLRPGGLLIYSTCTLNTRENEENVQWMMTTLGAEPLAVDTDEQWHITGDLYCREPLPVYRFIPGITKGEGLFMAVLRKSPEDDAPDQSSQKMTKRRESARRHEKPTGSIPPDIMSWLAEPTSYTFKKQGDTIIAIPRRWEPLYEQARQLRILHAGITVATDKGRQFIPHPSLALSLGLRRGVFDEVALTKPEAITYLRREPIAVGSNHPRGHLLFTYHDIPLGFAKNVGQRANNLYPQEWKIKSSHIPEEDEEILIKL